jgi:lipid A 3-O-deacylase
MRWEFVAAALCLISADADAQGSRGRSHWYKRPHSWTLYEENDAFATSDSTYTQGLRLNWNYAVWKPRWNRKFSVASLSFLVPPLSRKNREIDECVPLGERVERPCGSIIFGLGQTMYTPSDLTTPVLQTDQRPYAGYLWVSYGMAVNYPLGVISSQLQLGITGPPSLAQDAQSLAHWTWAHDSPQPQGWGNQIKTMPQVALVNQYSGRWPFMEYCRSGCNGAYTEHRIVDFTPRAQLDLGFPMTRASTGGMVRLGYGFPDILNADRIAVSAPPASARAIDEFINNLAPWIMAFASADGRAVAWNQLLSGTFADRGPNGWHTIKQIDTNHLVWETSYGVGVGSTYATIIYQRVSRGAEYHPNGGTHHYGAISFTIHSPPPAASHLQQPQAKTRLHAEALAWTLRFWVDSLGC